MASGWNIWMWLECKGVISEWCCKEVYRFLHNTYFYSTCIRSFLAAASLLLCSFLNVFFILYNIKSIYFVFHQVHKCRAVVMDM